MVKEQSTCYNDETEKTPELVRVHAITEYICNISKIPHFVD